MESLLIFSYIFAVTIFHGTSQITFESNKIHFIEPGDVLKNQLPGLQIFCHNAKTKYLAHIWKVLIINLTTSLESYELYEGKTPQVIRQRYEENKRSWTLHFFGTMKHKQLKINPFQDVCIGIYTEMHDQNQYEVSMTQLQIDTWKIASMALGIIIFWYARKLSQNDVFYYCCGVVIGVVTSLMILIYFTSKLFPKGKFMYLTLITGYTLSFYLAQILWENAQLIIIQYKEWLMWYILTTSLLSFIICYRLGPITNSRTKNIIQWTIQVLCLILLYQSSYIEEISIAICVLLIITYNFPTILVNKTQGYWKRIFPARRKLLTEDQYREESIRETKKALNELKEYCSSPECNPWKTILRLKDPIRFAKFVEGDSHLSDNENREYDLEITRIVEENEYTDDEIDYY